MTIKPDPKHCEINSIKPFSQPMHLLWSTYESMNEKTTHRAARKVKRLPTF
jgi:hypothetical protein